MNDREIIYEASKRLYERKSAASPERYSIATDERIGAILTGTDLTASTVKQAVNEWLGHFEDRMGERNSDQVDFHLGDLLMDTFLTGILYEQIRSANGT